MHKAGSKVQGIAIVREVSDSYNDCYLEYNHRQPINVELAKMEHGAYVEALGRLGLQVIVLPSDQQFPDGCFVEDVAVVLDDLAIITRMGTNTREGEQARVAQCLSKWMELVYMNPPRHA